MEDHKQVAMSLQDRQRWDGVFRQVENFPQPDPFLLQYTPIPHTEDARALDLCGGMGQNGLWLAEQGYTTDIMDISRVALNKARVEMTLRNLRSVNLLQVDVDDWHVKKDEYELVCVFRYMRRDLFDTIKYTIKPTGRLIYETYNIRYLEEVKDFNPFFLLRLDELPRYFEGWQLIAFEEENHISRLVVSKPA
jgi:tellurite methyltransferase